MPLDGAAEAGEAAGLLLEACRQSGIAVCHIQHVSTRPGAAFFLPDTIGVEIHQSAAPLSNF